MTEITQTALSTQRSVHISNAHPRLLYKATLFLFVFSLSFLFISCSHNPVGPGEILTPGRRDYVWTVDTINKPNIEIFRFGGNNANHFWIWGTGDNELLEYINGSIKLRKDPGVYDISCITKSDSNNVWIGTFTGKIFKLINNTFIFQHQVVLPNDARFIIYDIKVQGNKLLLLGTIQESENYQSAAFIYSNRLSTRITYQSDYTVSAFINMEFNGDASYILGSSYYNNIDSIGLYKETRNKLELITKGSYRDNEYISVSVIENNLFVLIGWDLYMLQDKALLKITTIPTDYEPFITGRTMIDMFARSQDGVKHYNGTDWKYIFKMSGQDLRMYDSMILQNDIFFIAHDYGTRQNLLIHGKLQ